MKDETDERKAGVDAAKGVYKKERLRLKHGLNVKGERKLITHRPE